MSCPINIAQRTQQKNPLYIYFITSRGHTNTHSQHSQVTIDFQCSIQSFFFCFRFCFVENSFLFPSRLPPSLIETGGLDATNERNQ